jgi:hypothetical protein
LETLKSKAMKKAIRILLLTIFFITFTVALNSLMAQPMPGGDPSGDPNNQPVGGYAPVGSGLVILLALGAGYGTKKVYDARKKILE